MRINIPKLFPKACKAQKIEELFIESTEILAIWRDTYDNIVIGDTLHTFPCLDNGIIDLINITDAEAKIANFEKNKALSPTLALFEEEIIGSAKIVLCRYELLMKQ